MDAAERWMGTVPCGECGGTGRAYPPGVLDQIKQDRDEYNELPPLRQIADNYVALLEKQSMSHSAESRDSAQ